VGFWRSLVGLDLSAPEVDPDLVFAASGDELAGGADVDPAVFGLGSYAIPTAPAPRIDRRSAIQVPAVKRCRDLIAGSLGGLPLDLYNADRTLVQGSPFAQPERNVPRSVTMTRLFEDMLFEQTGWWLVTERNYRNYPLYFKRLAPGRVSIDEDRDKLYVDGRERDPKTGQLYADNVIRFDSPTDGLLKAGARAIRTCLQLDAHSANAADGVPAVQYFTPKDGADPAEDDEITELLDTAQEARRRRVTGYLPASLELIDAGWDPQKLQLIEQRQHAVIQIANVAGVDPEDLGVSTTSRTYSNGLTRRQWFIDMTLGLYRQAVEDRLSMGDITPQGQYLKFNLDAFLRSDAGSRYAAYAAGLQVGALDVEDIARLEDKPVGSVQPAAPAPSNVTQLPTRQESA
jgi:phage portal protein BeeE